MKNVLEKSPSKVERIFELNGWGYIILYQGTAFSAKIQLKQYLTQDRDYLLNSDCLSVSAHMSLC